MFPNRDYVLSNKDGKTTIQGFLTNKGRFVERNKKFKLKSMSWQQDLINASVSVSRSIFEMNTDLHEDRKIPPRKEYIISEVKEAIKNLQKCLDKLKS